jgi:predicted ArsR family transcriptional regulator
MTQLDLLTYPNTPGSKVSGPSREAAEAVRPSAATLRVACLHELQIFGPKTADECAAWLEENVLAVRPRFSELLALGLIEDTGIRRKNASGRNATVWRCKA